MRLLTGIGATLAIVAGTLVTAPAASAATDDYPSAWKSAARDTLFDTWGMYNRECVSWVAWRLHKNNKYEMPFHANASYWGSKAKTLGYIVDHVPAVGSVAWWSGNHVAMVESVNSGGTITISEYNIGGLGKFGQRTIASTIPSGFIHFKDIAVNLSNGAYINYLSKTYRIVGGAPIFVPNWTDFGGKQASGSVTSTQWATLAIRPADGTYVKAMPSGNVYRMVGGAPVYLSDWAAVGGVKPTTTISDTDIVNARTAGATSVYSHLRYYPADGSYVTTGSTPTIYKITGGAADPVADWASVGGVQPAVQVGADDISKAGSGITSAYSHLKGVISGPTPTIVGQRRVGYNLHAVHGSWTPGSLTYSYTWLRNGKPIVGAHGAIRKLTSADRGASLSVRVTITRSGYRTTTVTSSGTIRVK